MFKIPSPHSKKQQGFTIIELLITMLVIGTVVTGLFGLFLLSLRTAQEGERRVVAVALANERAEMIRNLPYVDVGTTSGIPPGSIAQQETITRNGLDYSVQTDIRYIDDPYDGVAGGNPHDALNTDYKQARIEVRWNSPNDIKPVLLITVIAPPGIEGGEVAGTLIFQALNSAGEGVSGAGVNIVNNSTSPAINITTQTDDVGRVVIPGLPEQAGTYELSISKDSYTPEQTYTQTSTFFPDTDHAHLTALQGQVTYKTFAIDFASAIGILTQDEEGVPIGNVSFSMNGTKSIGVDESEQPVKLFNENGSTDVNGLKSFSHLVWDQYEFTVDGDATGYDIKETSEVLPLAINPGDDLSFVVTLVPHTPISLHVTVTSPTGEPIDNATVEVVRNAFSETQGTGVVGQVLFADLPEIGDYTVTVNAPNYQEVIQITPVADTTRVRLELTPV